MGWILLIIVLIGYFWSVKYATLFYQAAYSKDGRWEIISPTSSDIIMVYFPLMNTLAALGYFAGDCYKESYRRQHRNGVDDFFGIKRDAY